MQGLVYHFVITYFSKDARHHFPSEAKGIAMHFMGTRPGGSSLVARHASDYIQHREVERKRFPDVEADQTFYRRPAPRQR